MKKTIHSRKLLRKLMKITALQLIIGTIFSSVCLAFDGHAQDILDQSIQLKAEDAKLRSVLNTIEQKYEVQFVYSSRAIGANRKVDVLSKDQRLADFLDQLLLPMQVGYRVMRGRIILTPIVTNTAPTNRLDDAPTPLFQQIVERTITGTVTDQSTSEPLPGVSVLAKGTNAGTTTDVNGKYRLVVPDNAEALVFSSVGFIGQEVAIGNRTMIDLTLAVDEKTLSEVVVIGYGQVERKDLTGSVASIKGEEVAKIATARFDDALRGKVSGVQITPTSGQPGAGVSIRIRGSNSLNASNEPLIVIDGFIGAGDLNNINTNDIESIEVLKDASATAIYGSRGSNGVILVTTKRGKEGKSNFTFDTYTGTQSITRKLDLMNARQYAEFQNDIAASTGASPFFPNISAVGPGTNWQDEIFRTAPITSSTLSISGGTAKTNFYLSGNYLSQQGIYINTGFKRYLTRLNLDHRVNSRLKTGVSLSLSKSNRNGGTSSLRNVLGYDPTLDVRDQNGEYVTQNYTSEFTNDNPVSLARQTLNTNGSTDVIGNVYGELKILKDLTYRLAAGIKSEFTDIDVYSPSTLYAQRDLAGTATVENRQSFNILTEQTLNYVRTFGAHSINLLAGYTRQTDEYKQRRTRVNGFATDEFTTNNIDAATTRLEASSTLRNTGLESWLGRANYIFRDKYLLTLSGRADGSSVFAKNNKWSFFPSVALAWRVIEEDFMQGNNTISDLKLRASYGRIGNQAISPYQSLSPIANGGNQYILGVAQNVVTGFAPNALSNDNLRWETTTSLDFGVDVSFLNNKLTATLDYYRKTTDDLLVQVTVPQLTGFNNTLRNFGKVQNNGLEFSLTSANVNTKDFRWETSFNIAGNRNTVVDIFNPEGFFLTNSGVSGTGVSPSGIIKEGEPLGAFYGLKRNGIWNDQAEIDASGLSGYAVFPGGRRYEDIDGDGKVEAADDRTIIGDANPKFFGGLTNNFSYKGIELSFFFQFVSGNQIFNEADYFLGQAFDYNAYASLTNRWTPQNTNTDIPSIPGNIRSIAAVSESDALKDGSFLRLRNVNLAYNLPVGKLKWIQGARIYATGTNLLLFDNYPGYDPEINRGTDNLRRGYDDSSYPLNRNLTIGLLLNF
ncbi:SusC/RagA family TonB-linked outer membrane protein [Persicitalea sp.]|uniref:SusC/RagA family TonB-linked outer membrane protein n=1 Tax=Persicitalea sp. TaxID=3100273 RepID=UPI0035937E31